MVDRSIELTRRQILLSTSAVGIAGAGAGLGTSALFSDEETLENNQLVAGELDMKVGWEEHYFRDQAAARKYAHREDGELVIDNEEKFMDATLLEQVPDKGVRAELGEGTADPCEVLADVPDDLKKPVIELEDVKPGDFGEVTFHFALCNNPGFVWINGGLVDESENGQTEPEAGNPDEGPGVELTDEIQVTIWYDDGDNLLEDPEMIVTDREFDPPTSSRVTVSGSDRIVAEDSLRDTLSQLATGNGLQLDGRPGTASAGLDCFTDAPTLHSIGFQWEVPVETGNEIQSDSVSFDLGFYVEQCRGQVAGSGYGGQGYGQFGYGGVSP
jgi:predicted ribosomally synthesized peptide with SipW-like signal peptide